MLCHRINTGDGIAALFIRRERAHVAIYYQAISAAVKPEIPIEVFGADCARGTGNAHAWQRQCKGQP